MRKQTNSVDRELARLRREQARRVMPLIGGVLDAFEAAPLDDLADVAPLLVEKLEALREANEGGEDDE